MSQLLVADIEAKNKDLNEKINQQAGYFSQINEAIKKLRNDRKTVQAQVSEMRGAVQAFDECLKRLKEAAPAIHDEAVNTPVETEVANG